MNSGATDVEQKGSHKTQQLSRFHPRSQGQTAEAPESTVEQKTKEEWVHTPSGPRRVRIPLSIGKSAPSVPVDKVEIPVAGEKPSVEKEVLLPTETSQAMPPSLLKQTSLVIKGGLAVLVLFALVVAFRLGESRSKWMGNPLPEVKPAGAVPVPPTRREFPEDLLPQLDAALELLRRGENLEALDSLNKMLAAHPDVPSLHYAAALAALQAGYPREADRLAGASIEKGFRVSDAYALKAAISAMQSKGPSAEQETLLKKALAADPMNSNPFIELASLLRYQNKKEQASSLLTSASLRMNPTDTMVVMETTKALLAIDEGENLLPPSQPLGIPSKDFPNAYSEMKRGNFENAASILRFDRDRIDSDLFYYLINDPALRKFASQKELSEFY